MASNLCEVCGAGAPFHLESVEHKDGTSTDLGDLHLCDQHMEGYLILNGLTEEQARETVVACLTP